MAVALIDDAAILGAKSFSVLDDLLASGSTKLGDAVQVGRNLARAPRLTRVAATKAFNTAQDLKPFLSGQAIKEIPETFIDDAVNQAIARAKGIESGGVLSAYSPQAIQFGKAIGNAQNSLGVGIEKAAGFLNSPAGLAVMLAPDLLYMGMTANQLSDMASNKAAQEAEINMLQGSGMLQNADML